MLGSAIRRIPVKQDQVYFTTSNIQHSNLPSKANLNRTQHSRCLPTLNALPNFLPAPAHHQAGLSLPFPREDKETISTRGNQSQQQQLRLAFDGEHHHLPLVFCFIQRRYTSTSRASTPASMATSCKAVHSCSFGSPSRRTLASSP